MDPQLLGVYLLVGLAVLSLAMRVYKLVRTGQKSTPCPACRRCIAARIAQQKAQSVSLSTRPPGS